MGPEDRNDGADGGPPSVPESGQADGNVSRMSAWIGGGSLAFASFAWLVSCLKLLDNLRLIPREVTPGDASPLVTIAFWLIGFLGGLLSVIYGRSKAGFLAIFVCVLLALAAWIMASIVVGPGWNF